METIYILLVLLVVARTLGELAVRFRQPALVGELLGGILVGVIAGAFSERLPVLAGLSDDPVFAAITDLGVFFLMLLAGIEMRPKEFAEASGSSLPVALCAMLLPLGLGFAVTWVWLPENEYRFAQALFVGTAMAITAVPVAVGVLRNLGQLDTRLGRLVVSAAVFDDVLSLILLAVLTAVIQTGGLPSVGEIGVLLTKILLFFAVTIAAGPLPLTLAVASLGAVRARRIRVQHASDSRHGLRPTCRSVGDALYPGRVHRRPVLQPPSDGDPRL